MENAVKEKSKEVCGAHCETVPILERREAGVCDVKTAFAFGDECWRKCARSLTRTEQGRFFSEDVYFVERNQRDGMLARAFV